jgi:hypothetical protein
LVYLPWRLRISGKYWYSRISVDLPRLWGFTGTGGKIMTKESAKIIYELLKEISYLRGLTSRESNLLKICKEKAGITGKERWTL